MMAERSSAAAVVFTHIFVLLQLLLLLLLIARTTAALPLPTPTDRHQNTSSTSESEVVQQLLPQQQQQQHYPIAAAGGYSTADLNDQQVKDLATFVATSLSQALSSSHPSLAEFRTISAQSQFAWGTNYKMEMELKERGKEPIKCSVIIFNHGWTNVRKMTKCSCCSSHSSSSSSNWSPSGKLINVSKLAASALLVVTTPSTPQSLMMMMMSPQQQHSSSINSAAAGAASRLDSNSLIHSLIGAITGLICSYFVMFSFHP